MFPDVVPVEGPSRPPRRARRAATPTLFSPSECAERRFWEFFTAHIGNRNTRLAYLAAERRLAGWCERRGLALRQIEPMVIAAYVEELTYALSPASVKQHLAALRMLFDWLVVGQVLPFNPASSVRGPRHVIKAGKTPVLSTKETRTLFDDIDISTLVGLGDHAFLGVIVYNVRARERCGLASHRRLLHPRKTLVLPARRETAAATTSSPPTTPPRNTSTPT